MPTLNNIKHDMSDRELNTVLHALRCMQEKEYGEPGECHSSLTSTNGGSCDHFSEHPPMNSQEIESLCDRLQLTENSTGSSDGWMQPAATALAVKFPWLLSDEEVSGADVVDNLADLYGSWQSKDV
jgi:hypothetical protein